MPVLPTDSVSQYCWNDTVFDIHNFLPRFDSLDTFEKTCDPDFDLNCILEGNTLYDLSCEFGYNTTLLPQQLEQPYYNSSNPQLNKISRLMALNLRRTAILRAKSV